MRARHFLLIPILLLPLFACKKKTEEPVKQVFSTFKEANDHLVDRHPSLKDWCIQDTLPTARIVVDSKNRRMLFMEQGAVVDSIGYTRSTFDVQSCNAKDVERFETLLKKWFNLDETVDVGQMASRVNAHLKPNHLNAILTYSTSWSNKALSILYNACIGNPKHDLVIACKNTKLVHASESIYARDTLSFIDEVRFVSLMNSGIDLGALSSPKALYDTLKREGILKQMVRDFDFVYYDVRGNQIHFGADSIGHKDAKVADCAFSILTHPQTVYVHRTNPSAPAYNYESLDERMKEMAGFEPCTIDASKLRGDKWVGEPELKPDRDYTWLYVLLGALLLVGALLFFLWKRNLMQKWFHFGKKGERKPEEHPEEEETAEPEKPETLFSSLDPEASILDILQLVDKALGTQKAAEYAHLQELSSPNLELEKENKDLSGRLKEQEQDRKLFARLVDTKTESELMDALKQVRKRHPDLPLVHTVSALADGLDPKANPSKQIEFLLGRIDKALGTKLLVPQQSFIRRTIAYDQCRKMIGGIDEGHDVPTVLRAAIDRFIAKGQTLDGAVEFVQQFKPAAPDMKEKDVILHDYHAMSKVLDDFRQTVQTVSRKENLEFWDRAALVLSSIASCSIPLLNVVDPANRLAGQQKGLLDDVKSDLLVAYISRFFLSGAQNENVSADLFRKTVSDKLEEAVSRYNAGMTAEKALLAIPTDDKTVKEGLDVLVTSVDKSRKYESMLPFIDGMWTTFVKEFLEKARTCEDEKFILENALNIAYHTADFLDHVRGGRDVPYCFNYAFLLSGFDPKAAHAQEFRHNDYAQSTSYSNFLFELAEKLGIEHLRILIDNYFIKP